MYNDGQFIIENGVLKRILKNNKNDKNLFDSHKNNEENNENFFYEKSYGIFKMNSNNGVLRIFGNRNFTEIGENAFIGCKASTIIISEGIVAIRKGAFENLDNLEHIILPSTLKVIGENAFKNCKKLKKIEFSSGLTEIQDKAFMNNDSLEYIEIPDGVTKIGNSTFKNCINLKEITLPISLEWLDVAAFSNCSSLLKIDIPTKVKALSPFLFKNCFSLKEVTFSDDIIGVGKDAFLNCHKIKKLTFPSTVKYFGYYNRNNEIKTSVKIADNCKELEELKINSGVFEIDEYELCNLPGLKRLYLPLGITSIQSNICPDSQELEYAEIPFDAKYIGFPFNEEFNNKIKQINFVYLNEKGEKCGIMIQVDSIFQIYKQNNCFIILDKDKKFITFVFKNGIEKFELSKLLELNNGKNSYFKELKINNQEDNESLDIPTNCHEAQPNNIHIKKLTK